MNSSGSPDMPCTLLHSLRSLCWYSSRVFDALHRLLIIGSTYWWQDLAKLLQDWPGRVGYWHVGVPPSGPMDAHSFRFANALVGNPENAAALELSLSGASTSSNPWGLQDVLHCLGIRPLCCFSTTPFTSIYCNSI